VHQCSWLDVHSRIHWDIGTGQRAGFRDVRERIVEAGGKEPHPGNCAKRDERHNQGILDEVLAFFPFKKAMEIAITTLQR